MQSAKNIKKHSVINRAVSGGICLLMFIIALAALASPVVKISQNRISPFKLIFSASPDSISFSNIETLTVSYYVYKYLYMLIGISLAVLLFLSVFFVVTNNKKASVYFNYFCAAIMLFLLVNMLIGYNYINIYNIHNRSLRVSTNATGFFIAGLVIFLGKFITSLVFDRRIMNEGVKDSGLSVAMSFILLALILSTLFTPVYSFPGTGNRLRGADILSGKDDALSFLEMSGAFKTLLVLSFFIGILSFLATIILFFTARKAFVRYNKVNTFIGITVLFMFAMMGFNYMSVFFEHLTLGIADAYSIFESSMISFSAVPLFVFLLLLIGIAFAKQSGAKIKMEYKIYGAPQDSGGARTAGTDAGGSGLSFNPIPAFSELDGNIARYKADYHERMKNAFPDPTLPKLVKHIIEYAKNSKERLSYGATEIKTFIAGMAASRLVILQGMSGTGKTSLPKIFMEAVDGYCGLVAIESSWRDKNELLGFYNEFSKKYTPKDFTQFLYKASLNKEIPFFIVLDELNLSRIEYYFSDFLSLMEARENERFITLFDVQLYPVEGREYSALRDGHTMDIPANVWFVGTSNRDESTFEISDKVYDRAQTINFDKRAPKVKTDRVDYAKKFVPCRDLQKLFNEALEFEFDAEGYEAVKQAEQLLRPYKISFGNRILKQMEDFVKVYTACSGKDGDRSQYIHEAVDCILFSKVVRKLELKQILNADALSEQFKKLNLPKCAEFLLSLAESDV